MVNWFHFFRSEYQYINVVQRSLGNSASPHLHTSVAPPLVSSQASAKSESNAGDGTTSAAVLTQALTFSWFVKICVLHRFISNYFFNWTYSMSEVLGQPPTIARLQDPSDPSFFAEKKKTGSGNLAPHRRRWSMRRPEMAPVIQASESDSNWVCNCCNLWVQWLWL